LGVVEALEAALDAKFVGREAPSLVSGYQSFPAADADLDVVAFGAAQTDVTSGDLAERSLMAGAGVDVGGAARMEMGQPVAALEGTAVVVPRSTSANFVVIVKLAHRTCGVDRDRKETPQKLGNSIEEYGR
jgi:hypothetical protein